MEIIKIYFILFIIYSILGWIMEVIATYPDTKCFVNRGFLIGPYCPIYGTCAILMICFLKYFSNSIMLFIMSVIICSIVEYITSFLLEKIFKARWWDYNKNKFNLNGRICLINSLLFGVLGFVLVKFVNPWLLDIIKELDINIINIIYYAVLTIFILDIIISFNVIFKIKDMSLKFVHLDNTKEITEKVKNMLSTKLLSRRIFKAFPNIRLLFQNTVNKIRKKTK